MTTLSRIDAETTVNDVVLLSPETLPVLASFGIDTCCGGPLSLAEVATRHRLDLAGLIAALEAAARLRD